MAKPEGDALEGYTSSERIGEILQKGKRRMCMTRSMHMNEAKRDVVMDRTR